MSYPPGPAVPPTSPDGRWWWDGRQWVPVGAPPAPSRGRSAGATAVIVVGVVIGAFLVVGILAAIAIPVFLNQRHKAVDSDLKTALQQVLVAEETYRVDEGAYAADAAALTPYVGDLPQTVDVWIVSASADSLCLEARSTQQNRAWWATENGLTQTACS